MNHVSRQGMMSIKLKLRILMLISVMTLCISIGVTAVGFDAVHRTGDTQVPGLMEIKASAFATVLFGSTFVVTVLSVLSVAMVAIVGTIVFLSRSIQQGLDGILGTLHTASESLDLSERAPVHGKDEFSRTAEAFNFLISRIAEVTTTVRSSAEMVSTASRQIAAGNIDLSSRTEQQAASLQQTAASMKDLTDTVRQNADNALQASGLAQTSAKIAVKGGGVVSEVVATMGEINASSERIGHIIAIVDEIAFRTNILALNAAVEAARAGTQGRGFAVVATEVRTLAQRSAKAAGEIKALIQDSVNRIGTGTRLVDQAGATMDEVVSSIKQVTQIVDEIAAASDEQRRGIDQVGKAVMQMDEVTQQNAALVEQAAAAAQSLDDQANRLHAEMGAFRL
ncbi:methyl-accepting chemotaxis protein [Paraburkholderia dilworthii]|uniref:methyl-accepting chemotaxis protein n=1 Tax=Paraburkholderia dilworthii TaxID=948106 RepID=UPI0038BDB24C